MHSSTLVLILISACFASNNDTIVKKAGVLEKDSTKKISDTVANYNVTIGITDLLSIPSSTIRTTAVPSISTTTPTVKPTSTSTPASNSTTTTPNSTTTTTSTPTTSKTTTTIKTSTSIPPTHPTPNSSTTSAPTPLPATTTVAPHHERKFDGPSFVGGIILALGSVAIGFVAFKYYTARTERNYHTL